MHFITWRALLTLSLSMRSRETQLQEVGAVGKPQACLKENARFVHIQQYY